MLRANRPILAFFDSIKALRVRQLALILKAGFDPNLMLNARGQNGLQFMINYFGATDAHYRLQAPINKSAYLSIAKLLLDSGLDPNAMDLLSDETVLFDAIRYNDREMVALLLNYVDLALRNKNGETALMCAARFGTKQVTRLLLDHLRHLEMDGYFLRQRNRFGLTALEIARSENLEAAKVLTKHLITYGHRAGTVLARSVSHHQLAGVSGADYATGVAYAPAVGRHGPAAVGSRRRHHHHQAATAAELFAADECFSPSDYDSDILAPATPLDARPDRRRGPGGGNQVAAVARGGCYPFYDAKAAEFSQYLLDQQLAMDSGDLGGGGGGAAGASGAGYGGRARGSFAATGAGGGRPVSEEEDVYGGGGGAGGQLVRSRSCMLGPAGTGTGGGGGGANKKQSGGMGAGKSAAGGWQDQSSGGGGGAN